MDTSESNTNLRIKIFSGKAEDLDSWKADFVELMNLKRLAAPLDPNFQIPNDNTAEKLKQINRDVYSKSSNASG
jgi:hypothetical protein